MASPVSIVHSHWHYHFDNVQFSTLEFYQLVEEAVRNKGIPHVNIVHIVLTEGGLLSAGRQYLRVSRFEHVFDICAAPFGNGFFISWWLGENEGCAPIFSKLPFIGRFFITKKTYFILDIETMFKESVRAAVNEAVECLVKTKGVRALALSEYTPKEYDKQYLRQ